MRRTNLTIVVKGRKKYPFCIQRKYYWSTFKYKMNCELMLTYDTPALRQTGSRNLTGQKRFPWYGVPIWSLWPNIRFLPSIVAEKNATKNGHIQNVCSMCIKINKVGKQEVGIWWVQKRFPRYVVPIWSVWLNIRFLPSIVTEKNEHICSTCIKINNKVSKQEVGIWWVQKLRKMRWKIFWTDKQTDRGKTVYPLPLRGAGVYKHFSLKCPIYAYVCSVCYI